MSDKRGSIAPVSVAPMMDRTDRHFRVLMRQISRRTLLYTEMVTTGALLHGDVRRHLDFSEVEHPIALQLGGDDPRALARCASLAEDWGYDEVNLNVGCPSDRVQNGNFGVCLMGDAPRVAAAVRAMRSACSLPVTVKHRIGFDDQDSYEAMLAFVDVVAEAGCDRFSVHARKAWLKGLSPKENRNVPPLRYEDVHRLKRERAGLDIEINGGIVASGIAEHLQQVDAVMIGRAAYDDPMSFAGVDQAFFGAEERAVSRHDVVRGMAVYADAQLREGHRLGHIARHLQGLFKGVPGGRKYRRHLAENAFGKGAPASVLTDALDHVS
ncbi:MAG: tRNA dihydrouridine(20/20a) synthase DusA [Proteobacteria bacterium]|nr:tRNA dihydrouridine(20/20a) synthase DusA [Pseudomonadota bacterium]MCP4917601.1 tRNA dihydrouridine(20/20a) synthase DusA [Pseudomonadota bacterium]